MVPVPDYSDEWLAGLNDSELQYWSMKPQSEKDWWAFNTKQKDRAMLLRTELGAREVHQSLLSMPEPEHKKILDKLKIKRDEALERLKSNFPDDA